MAIAILGMVFVASRLERVWPREVEVAYVLDRGCVAMDVDYVQGGEAIASARFTPQKPGSGPLLHRVRLQPGDYQVRVTMYRDDDGAREARRTLHVPSEGIIRFDLEEATDESR